MQQSRRKTAASKRSRLTKSTRKAVAKVAKQVFNRRTETKYVSEDMLGAENSIAQKEIYGDTIPSSGSAQVFPVLPDLAEGTTTNDYTRTGVKVNPVRFEADLELAFNSLRKDITGNGFLDQCSWDINVHVWYGFCRKYKQSADITANSVLIAQNLLDLGNGSTIRFSGAPLDHQLKLNKEYMVGMKHKVIRMYRPLGEQNIATLNGGLTTYFPQKLVKSMKLVFKTPKSLLFNQNNAQPENYAPFVIIGYEHNDNTQASNTYTAPGTTPADLLRAPALLAAIRSHLWFKDA